MTHYLIMSESVYRMCVCVWFFFSFKIKFFQCNVFIFGLICDLLSHRIRAKKLYTSFRDSMRERAYPCTQQTLHQESSCTEKKKSVYIDAYMYTRICISICISTNNTFTLGSPHELQATGSEDRIERVHFVQFAARKRGKMQDGFGWFKSSAGTKITLKLSNRLVAMAEVQTWCAHQKPFTYSFILSYLFLEFFFSLLIYLFFIFFFLFFFCLLYSSHFVFWFYYFCVYYFSLNATVWKPQMWLHIMSI